MTTKTSLTITIVFQRSQLTMSRLTFPSRHGPTRSHAIQITKQMIEDVSIEH